MADVSNGGRKGPVEKPRTPSALIFRNGICEPVGGSRCGIKADAIRMKTQCRKAKSELKSEPYGREGRKSAPLPDRWLCLPALPRLVEERQCYIPENIFPYTSDFFWGSAPGHDIHPIWSDGVCYFMDERKDRLHIAMRVRTTDSPTDVQSAVTLLKTAIPEVATLETDARSPHENGTLPVTYPKICLQLREKEGKRYYEVSANAVAPDKAEEARYAVLAAGKALLEAKEMAQCPDGSTAAFAQELERVLAKGTPEE